MTNHPTPPIDKAQDKLAELIEEIESATVEYERKTRGGKNEPLEYSVSGRTMNNIDKLLSHLKALQEEKEAAQGLVEALEKVASPPKDEQVFHWYSDCCFTLLGFCPSCKKKCTPIVKNQVYAKQDAEQTLSTYHEKISC